MSALRCDHCGTLFETDAPFLTADVVVTRTTELIAQVVLCEACARTVGDDLSLETTYQRHTGRS